MAVDNKLAYNINIHNSTYCIHSYHYQQATSVDETHNKLHIYPSTTEFNYALFETFEWTENPKLRQCNLQFEKYLHKQNGCTFCLKCQTLSTGAQYQSEEYDGDV